MQSTSTINEATAATAATTPPVSDSRTWNRAFGDIRQGFRSRELWGHLGWQDIKQRYRRSVIGPFWISIATGTMALGLGFLYSALFEMKVQTFLPYITAGFIIWQFILGCVTEGAETFISNEGVMKHLPAPLTVYALRTVWRQILLLAHNMIIYAIILVIFLGTLGSEYKMAKTDPATGDTPGTLHPGISFDMLLAIPGFVMLVVTGVWVALLFGVISARFRDIPQVIQSLVQLVFYVTPIIWTPDLLGQRGAAISQAAVQFNPLYHYVQVVRAPLLGQHVDWWSWLVVLGLSAIGWGLALIALKNYRSRVSYWV
ncbi:sugar ABC transporter permease [Amycolatopsis antarctica]|uniref:Sugar ABC transporter permease n=1 Tax=Amycolatopsis antarctica TaxID=1854586 RepID=A0A263D5H3_9PSEU|nr:ABC transporter permease [Amycolatopsis antarctica]OZM73439.1 sugar ABC transporter permease [Amycolatopsis antarctica]